MEVVSGVDNLRPEHGRLFVVVGVFDGLHTGHAYLLEHLRKEAGKRDARPSVITFDHHPDEILTAAHDRALARHFLLGDQHRLVGVAEQCRAARDRAPPVAPDVEHGGTGETDLGAVGVGPYRQQWDPVARHSAGKAIVRHRIGRLAALIRVA